MKQILFYFYLLSLISCNISNSKKINFVLNKDSINFGKLEFNDTLITTIYIKNIGNSLIKITNIETECGCTSVLMKDSSVRVHDSIPLKLTYIPSFSNDSGNIIKYITFRTNSTPVFKNFVIKGLIFKDEK